MKYTMLCVLLASACIAETAYVAFGDTAIRVEIADEPQELSRGLMFRESLAENAGMLFVFPDEAPRSFWMKNTKIPLDIIFISSNLTIVNIQTMEPCYGEPCTIYASKEPAKYALEVNKGFAEKSGVKIGDKVEVKFP